MPELHSLTPILAVLQDKGLKVALVTDGRMSGASGKVPSAIHVSPGGARRRPARAAADGDCRAGRRGRRHARRADPRRARPPERAPRISVANDTASAASSSPSSAPTSARPRPAPARCTHDRGPDVTAPENRPGDLLPRLGPLRARPACAHADVSPDRASGALRRAVRSAGAQAQAEGRRDFPTCAIAARLPGRARTRACLGAGRRAAICHLPNRAEISASAPRRSGRSEPRRTVAIGSRDRSDQKRKP